MFYTRPNLPKLGIDLVDVQGGGSRPAQFYGVTAEGRQIYIRYRHGWIRVWAGDEGDPFQEELLSAAIGPALDGDMLLEQACDLTGITVRGEKPPLSDEEWRAATEEGAIRDWSGRTTYWERDLLISKEGAERLAEALATAFPDMLILECLWLKDPFRRVFVRRKTIRECEDGAFFCFDPQAPAPTWSSWFGMGADARLRRLISGEHVEVTDLDRTFKHYLSMRIPWNQPPPSNNWREKLGMQTPESERMPDHIELPKFQLLGELNTKFTTGDPAGERYAQKLVETIDSCFSTWAEDVDLDTGKVVGTPREIRW